jgi:ribosome-binding ATPase YchF (GTP1/OBG family)
VQIGIVGKSNTGKSTFFRAATLVDAEISNRIFTTIKPNRGAGYISTECPCKSLDVECDPQNSNCVNGVRLIPIKLIDVAGLVPDAHMGKGLGNQFLSDIMEASGLIHVVDASGGTDREGNPIEPGSHNPKEDIDFLPREIDYWIFGILNKNWNIVSKKAKSGEQKLEELICKQLSGLKISIDDVSDSIKQSGIKADSEDAELLKFIRLLREKSRPIIVAANKADLPEAEERLGDLKGLDTVPCSAEAELALREAERHGLISYTPGSGGFEIRGEPSGKQRQGLEFIRKNVLEKYGSTGVQACLNRLVFEKLGMITVYPVANMSKLSDSQGHVLPDVHLVPRGTTLKELAARVHTTMAEAFIGGLDLEKKKIGADYKLRDGDVVEILFKG